MRKDRDGESGNDMEKIVKRAAPFILIYITFVIFAAFSLFLVSRIPQSWLTKNWKEDRNTDLSANYFHLLSEGDYATLIDDYTDNMKIDIAYRLNEQSIFVPSAYVESSGQTYEYGRYWHGYCIVIRPLLIFFNLNQLRVFYGILLTAAFLLLLCVLVKRKLWMAVISLAAAIYFCNFYVTAMSLQYFNCVFLALTASILIIYDRSFYTKQKYLLFFLIGMLVNYFDFLTFETLTLSLPLFFAEIENDEAIFKRVWNIVKSFLFWGIGYVIMFLTKCLLYITVNKSEAVELLQYKILQRTIGNASSEQYSFREALMMTLSGIKGINFINYRTVVFLLTSTFLILILIRVFIKSQWLEHAIIIFLIGFVPFVRFFVVREHSSSHSYYTYYALFTTVTGLIYVIGSFFISLWRKF